jgi:hypothetical protein
MYFSILCPDVQGCTKARGNVPSIRPYKDKGKTLYHCTYCGANFEKSQVRSVQRPVPKRSRKKPHGNTTRNRGRRG